MAKANGTIARDIALYFFEKIDKRCTPSMVAKTVVQAKSLLSSGYTEEEIINTIDYIVDETSTKIYSLGYINSAINSVLEEVNKKKNKEIVKQQEKEIEATSEEVIDVESRERNERKIDGFGAESWKRKEPYSDLFE